MKKTINPKAERHKWGDGPWAGEADRIEWIDPASGLPCLAIRHPTFGHWCGYVGVGHSHPLYGKEEYDAAVRLSPHGGVTFADGCDGDPDEGVCHRTEGKDEVWWFGFDCGHAFDLSPAFRKPTDNVDESYRDEGYVIDEITALARELSEVT